MEIEFIPVDAGNRKRALRLSVAPEQAGTVETVSECLHEADNLALWRPVLLQVDGADAGFAMYGLWNEEGEYSRVWLDRFFIDQRFQRRGYARAVLPALIRHIREAYGCEALYLSVYETNRTAIRLYETLGFAPNGERDINGEVVMACRFSP